uniref:Magnesium transporter protein 1 n=1 Tax=Mesocestoides corti TaxID=53468 RepID=A0A5K3EWP1_MESCO
MLKVFFVVCLFFVFIRASTSRSHEKLLDDKLLEIINLPKKDGLIDLDLNIFERYVVSSPRNYSFVFVVGTRVAKCEPCKPAMDSLSNIALQWQRDNMYSPKIFFGFIDFALSMELISLLEIATAPYVFHYGPLQPYGSYDKTNKPQVLTSPDMLAEWISKISNVKVKASKQLDFSAFAAGTVVILLVAIISKVKWLRNSKFLAVMSLMFICTMCSGCMWVSIHSMPFISTQGGKVVYFIPENRAQLGFECLLVMLFYTMTSGGIVFLTNKCPSLRHRGFVYAGGIVIGVVMSVLGFNQMAEYYSMKAGYLPYHISLL